MQTAQGIRYAYTEASIGSPTNNDGSHVKIDYTVPDGTEMVAWTHSHADYVADANNEFSGAGVPYRNTDIGIAIEMKVDAYVTTPNGDTQKFDYDKRSRGEKSIFFIDQKSPSDRTDPKNNGITSDYENFIKLGNIEFNSNNAKPSTKVSGVLIVKDVKTQKDYGVIRNDNGKYDFYNGNGSSQGGSESKKPGE